MIASVACLLLVPVGNASSVVFVHIRPCSGLLFLAMLHYDSSGLFLSSKSDANTDIRRCTTRDLGMVLAAILDRQFRDRAVLEASEWPRQLGLSRRLRNLGLTDVQLMASVRPSARSDKSSQKQEECRKALEWYLSCGVDAKRSLLLFQMDALAKVSKHGLAYCSKCSIP